MTNVNVKVYLYSAENLTRFNRRTGETLKFRSKNWKVDDEKLMMMMIIIHHCRHFCPTLDCGVLSRNLGCHSTLCSKIEPALWTTLSSRLYRILNFYFMILTLVSNHQSLVFILIF